MLRAESLTWLSFRCSLSVTAQDVDVEAGKTLFRNNCASCHNKDMKSKMTGPAWWCSGSLGRLSSGRPLQLDSQLSGTYQ
ncbi:MAG: c-type cytochrome [Saprospiraceae bacterium]